MTGAESADHSTSSEREQLESWFDSLTDDQREAVLAVDADDIPGWMIASLVDANLHTDKRADDFKNRVPQALREFVQRRRNDRH